MLANYGFKLRYVLRRVLVISLGFLAGFGLLYWLLALRWELVQLTFEQQFFGCMALAGIVVFLGLRSRIDLFYRGSDDRWITLFYLAPAMMLTFAALATGELLTASTGQLATLQQPAEAAQHAGARFYTLQQAYFHKPGSSLEIVVTPTGKNGEQLRIDAHVACPVLATAADTVARQAPLWLAWQQSETIRTSLPDSVKEVRYQEFLRRCEAQFRAADLSKYQYLARITDVGVQQVLTAAASRSAYRSPAGGALVLQPHLEPFTERTIKPLRALAWSLGLGWGVYALMLLFPAVAATQVEEWRAGARPTDLLAAVKPYVQLRPGYFLTPLLVGLLVGVYLLMAGSGLGVVAFRPADLLRWGAIHGPSIAAGQWWRLLSGSVLHAGLLHLCYNVVALGFISWLLESVIGSWLLLLLYLLSAVAAGFTSIGWQPAAVSVGASGVIFGLFGAAIALGQSPRLPQDTRSGLVLFSLLFGGISLLLGFFIPGTNNAAHLGGLAVGMVAGSVLVLTLPQTRHER